MGDSSLEAQVADLGAVVVHLGLDEFDLWGALDGAAVAVSYAAQRPERLSRLVLWAPFPQGADIVSPGQSQSIIELVRQNWSLARRAMADVIYPNGPTELQRWLAGVMRESISPETAAKYLEFQSTVDIADLLPRVKTPTLVLSRRGDRNVPSRAAMSVATLIPDARFVVLEGDIGVPSHGDTSYLESVIEFLNEGREKPPPPAAPSGLVTILFTDMESSTALRRKLGDAEVQVLLRAHNEIVRAALGEHEGREIKHTGDGIMASFSTATSALRCSIAIQRSSAAAKEGHQDSPRAGYIGLNAGEPLAEDDDLFGTSVGPGAAHLRPRGAGPDTRLECRARAGGGQGLPVRRPRRVRAQRLRRSRAAVRGQVAGGGLSGRAVPALPSRE